MIRSLLRRSCVLVLPLAVVASSALAQPSPRTQPSPTPPADLPDDDGTDRPEDVEPPAGPTRGPTAATAGLTFDHVVVLRSGSTLRCAVIETVPDVRYVVVLPTGESRSLPWSEVERIEPYVPPPPAGTTTTTAMVAPGAEIRVEATTPPPPPTLPALLRGVLVPPGTAGGRRLRIRSESRRAVEIGVGDPERAYERLCSTPCELRMVPGRHRLRFAGEGVVPYDAAIDLRAGPVQVVAEAPTTAARTGGIVAMAGGGAVLVGGLVVLLAATASDSAGATELGVGISGLTVGLGGFVAGAVLVGGSSGSIVVRPLDR